VTLTLPFLGVRVIYSVAGSFDKAINPYNGTFALSVVLKALMEYVVVIILVVGVVTRNVREDGREVGEEEGIRLNERPRAGFTPGVVASGK